ncbi:30664_t:CDS:1, partial [Racocetra persica]
FKTAPYLVQGMLAEDESTYVVKKIGGRVSKAKSCSKDQKCKVNSPRDSDKDSYSKNRGD